MKQSKRKAKAQMVTEPDTAQDAVGVFSFESPESESIASASYDPITLTLTVYFKRKGSTEGYDYDGFPLSMWEEFMQASSKGRYMADLIRPIFAGRKRAA